MLVVVLTKTDARLEEWGEYAVELTVKPRESKGSP